MGCDMRPEILVVTGPSCSGKAAAISRLKEIGAYRESIDTSDDILRPEAARKGITDVNGLFWFASQNGPEYLFQKVADVIGLPYTGSGVVVGSVRQIRMYGLMKKAYGDQLGLLVLAASPETRFQRRQARKKSGDPESFEAFIHQEGRDVEIFGMDRLFEMGDHAKYPDGYTIVNEGNLERLYQELDVFLSV